MNDKRTTDNDFDVQLPLDIPLSFAPRESRHGASPSAPHALLAGAQSRLVFVGVCFVIAFAVVALRLTDVMIFHHLHDDQVVENIEQQQRFTQPLRATLTDRTGEVLAISLPTKSLYADPKNILDAKAAARGLIKVLPDLNYDDVLQKLSSERRFIWLKRNLTPDEIYKVNALGQPGLEFESENVRIYPAGSSTVHVVGLTDVDGNGLSGMERALNSALEKNEQTKTLSLDLRLQHVVEREVQDAITTFNAIGGTGVVLDTWSGEVLAAVSLPTYLPAQVSEANDEQRFNRFSLGVYELGSVMKVVNTAAALESGKIHLGDFFEASQPITYGRFRINDYHPVHRPLSVEEIFLYSSNIGSAHMAMQMGTKYQREFMCRVGLCQNLETELPELGLPQIPSDWKDLRAMTAAYGHGVAFSPLQYMRAVSTIMNGGYLTPITFMKRDPVDHPLGQQVMSTRTSELVRRVMRANVTSDEGSGKKAEVDGYCVGGKTGTAEKNQGRHYEKDSRISSFVGAFPMTDPRYLVFVMIDEPKPTKQTYGFATGGWVAAPVVGHIIAQMGPLLGIPPMDENAPQVLAKTQLTIRTQKNDSDAH